MKKIITLILLMVYSLISYSQIYDRYEVIAIDANNNTPRYLIRDNENKKDTVGIVITIKQAQKIDNDYELMELYKKMSFNCDTTVSYLLRIVDDYKQKNIIYEQKIEIENNMLNNQKEQIDNLKEQIDILHGRITLKDSIISSKDDIIKINNKEIKKYKHQRNKVIIIFSTISAILLWTAIGHPGIN